MANSNYPNKKEMYEKFSKFLIYGIFGIFLLILIAVILIALGVFSPTAPLEESETSEGTSVINRENTPLSGLTGFFANFLTGRTIGTRKDIYYNEGFVGIGTSTPIHRLDVKGGNIYTNGSVFIGVNSTLKLDVNGPARFRGSPRNIEGALVWDDGGKYYKYYNGTGWLSILGNIPREPESEDDTASFYNPYTLWSQMGQNIYYNLGYVGIGTDVPTTKLDIASNSIRLRESLTPELQSCNKGTITYDANYIYICVSANTWKRASLSSFALERNVVNIQQ